MKDQQLLEGLVKDAAEIEAEVSRVPSQETIKGDQAFAPSAIRIKNKIIGQKELQKIDKDFKESLEEIARTSNFRNETDMTKFKMEAMKRFNVHKLQTLESGYKFEQMLRDRITNAEEQMQMINDFSDTVKFATAIGVSGMGSDKSKAPAAATAPQSSGVETSSRLSGGRMKPMGSY